jgi:hypothetical protein
MQFWSLHFVTKSIYKYKGAKNIYTHSSPAIFFVWPGIHVTSTIFLREYHSTHYTLHFGSVVVVYVDNFY